MKNINHYKFILNLDSKDQKEVTKGWKPRLLKSIIFYTLYIEIYLYYIGFWSHRLFILFYKLTLKYTNVRIVPRNKVPK